MTPTACYTIWYTPRSGSNLLCDALTSTGVAGTPEQLLSAHETFNLLAKFGVRDATSLQQAIWDAGMGDNGVFGLRCQQYEPYFTHMLGYLAQFPGCPPDATPAEIWEHAFPGTVHIHLTRRNKVRQAVSWFKATQNQEWFRETGSRPPAVDLRDAYDKASIQHYLLYAVMCEAKIQEFFTAGSITPLSFVYEDMATDLEGTVRTILRRLGSSDADTVEIAEPVLTKIADDVSDEWMERYRHDQQSTWAQRW